MSELIKRYTDFQKKNAEIKARHKQERIAELQPYLADIGRAVTEDRKAGKTVQDMADSIGNKNRNFLYSALRAFYQATTPQTEAPEPTSTPTTSATHEFTYTIVQPGDNLYDVTLTDTFTGDSHYVLVETVDGTVQEIPHDWTVDKAHKALYAQIINEIESRAE